MDLAWDDLRTVLMMVRHGTLAGAAAELSVNYTTVARRIRRAEDAMGTRLFERLPDGYQPTQTARVVAEHAAEMEEAELGLRRHLTGTDPAIKGPLTITAPQLLIASFLGPVLDQFDREYPEIELRVLATNDLLDLSRLEADLGIRISRNPGDTLTGIRLLKQENASFASPELAAHIKANPTDTIDWIVYDMLPSVPKGIRPEYPNNRVRFRFDDMVAMIGAAQAGLGVVRTPIFLGNHTAGLELVPVLTPQSYADIWVVSHPDVWPSKKLDAFRKILIPYCKSNSHKFVM